MATLQNYVGNLPQLAPNVTLRDTTKKIVEKIKSYATTVKTTTTVFQENAQDTNLKLKSSKFKRENVYQKLKQRGDYKKITQTN